jgi:hypothetical protein
MPAKYVRPYSKGEKNDYRDAEAIADPALPEQPGRRMMIRAKAFTLLGAHAMPVPDRQVAIFGGKAAAFG